MNREEIRETVVRLLGEVAPEVDVTSVQDDVPLRDQIDLDSMDWLNYIVALDEELHVGIPEADYQSLDTVDAFVAYIADRVGAPA